MGTRKPIDLSAAYRSDVPEQISPRASQGRQIGGTSVLRRHAAALGTAAILLLPVLLAVWATRDWSRRTRHALAPAVRHLPYPRFPLPLQIADSQYVPLKWSDLKGWTEDDHLAAYRAFRTSCRPILAQDSSPPDGKALGTSLRAPCRVARGLHISSAGQARRFFERYFVPLKISRLGQDDGFVTGYYEPILDGSRTESDVYHVPVYRRPTDLFMRGYSHDAPSLPNKGPVYRKIGDGELAPYYDRAEIENGAIATRGLEICWLKHETSLLFAQIQGSARIHLRDGSTIRINYDSYNGYPYTPVGRILIDRGIIPKDEMSMQKIREWMEQNPEAAKNVRQQNQSYIFFHEVPLIHNDEPVGAQGVPLTPGRSIAVDDSLHAYGTPFFISGELPIESARSKTPFHRLMIAQDTGSAITGPARADLYFGSGPNAGKVAGRLREHVEFVMLVPKSLDPVARGHKMPLPDPRPSETPARLLPQTDPAKEQSGVAARLLSTITQAADKGSAPASGPLPDPRPGVASGADARHDLASHQHR
jgi:peptidoglycan lytic transglycosylase A